MAFWHYNKHGGSALSYNTAKSSLDKGRYKVYDRLLDYLFLNVLLLSVWQKLPPYGEINIANTAVRPAFKIYPLVGIWRIFMDICVFN